MGGLISLHCLQQFLNTSSSFIRETFFISDRRLAFQPTHNLAMQVYAHSEKFNSRLSITTSIKLLQL